MNNLFESYIDVCNKALQENAGRFPFEQMIMAAQNENGSAPECNCIVGGQDGDIYHITLVDRKITFRRIDKNNDANSKNARNWHVTMSYLEDVTEHPDHYIENPARLNWDWLY